MDGACTIRRKALLQKWWRIIGHRKKIHVHDLVADGILTPEGRVIP